MAAVARAQDGSCSFRTAMAPPCEMTRSQRGEVRGPAAKSPLGLTVGDSLLVASLGSRGRLELWRDDAVNRMLVRSEHRG